MAETPLGPGYSYEDEILEDEILDEVPQAEPIPALTQQEQLQQYFGITPQDPNAIADAQAQEAKARKMQMIMSGMEQAAAGYAGTKQTAGASEVYGAEQKAAMADVLQKKKAAQAQQAQRQQLAQKMLGEEYMKKQGLGRYSPKAGKATTFAPIKNMAYRDKQGNIRLVFPGPEGTFLDASKNPIDPSTVMDKKSLNDADQHKYNTVREEYKNARQDKGLERRDRDLTRKEKQFSRQIEIQDRLTPKQIKEKAGLTEVKAKISDIRDLKKKVNTGPIDSRVARMSEFLGLENVPLTGDSTKDTAVFNAMVGQNLLSYIKEQSGVQYSVKELEYMRSVMPNGNEPSHIFDAKLEQLDTWLRQKDKIYTDALRKYGKNVDGVPYGVLEHAPPPFDPSSVPDPGVKTGDQPTTETATTPKADPKTMTPEERQAEINELMQELGGK